MRVFLDAVADWANQHDTVYNVVRDLDDDDLDEGTEHWFVQIKQQDVHGTYWIEIKEMQPLRVPKMRGNGRRQETSDVFRARVLERIDARQRELFNERMRAYTKARPAGLNMASDKERVDRIVETARLRAVA